jgi:kumamolisin
MAQNKNMSAIPNSIQAPLAGAMRVGPADAKEAVSVSIRVRRRNGPPMPDLTTFNAAPAKRRAYVSREEFAQSYGAEPADLEKVAEFAKGHGLSVVESSVPRRTVVVSGTVQQMNEAFGVGLSLYQSQSAVYRGHEGTARVPIELADTVESVLGLDNRPLLQPHVRAAATGQAVTPLTPPLVAQLYQFPAGPATGQTIGIIEFGVGTRPATSRTTSTMWCICRSRT